MTARYQDSYADVWDSVAEIIRRFDPKASAKERRARAALIVALMDGLPTFLGADTLRKRFPAGMQKRVVALIKAIASGKDLKLEGVDEIMNESAEERGKVFSRK